MVRRPRHDLQIGVDTGGTFTDLVVLDGGSLRLHKVPSTPDDPSRAVLRGLQDLGILEGSVPIVHGTTVATNAFLQRRGGRTALITTAGFEDVLVLGRQARPQLFRLDPPPRRDWIPARLRFGLPERRGPRGELWLSLRRSSVVRLRRKLRRLRLDAVAICFLHSYAHPRHEEETGRALGGEGWHLSLSHRVSGEFREYERTCTTVANATLARPLGGYLRRLGGKLGRDRLRVLTSSAGWISAQRATAYPVRTVLSGPAGGALGAALLGRRAGFERLIAVDMGGTSTDVSICEGEVPRVHSLELDGVPLLIPALEIKSLATGGGSIARLDAGGALRVGPESAGAVPGPACYDRGGKAATVTDAHMVLGRLPPEGLLGGRVPLSRERALEAVGRLGRKAGLTVEETARGILKVADAALEGAVRSLSAGRGRDPARYALLAFGGAGGLHACSLASALGMGRILVPPGPGVFSALGLASSAPTFEASRSVLLRARSFPINALAPLLAPLEREGTETLIREGHSRGSIRCLREADLRYVGQSHELTVPVTDGMEREFHRAHARAFGYARRGEELELVTLRVRLTAPGPALSPPRRSRAVFPRLAGSRDLTPPKRDRRFAPIHARASLRPGARVKGPALITEYSASVWVAPGYVMRLDPLGNLVLSRGRGLGG